MHEGTEGGSVDTSRNAELHQSLVSERARLTNERQEIENTIHQLEQIMKGERDKLAYNLKLKTEIDLRISDIENGFSGIQSSSTATAFKSQLGAPQCRCNSLICVCKCNTSSAFEFTPNENPKDPFTPHHYDPWCSQTISTKANIASTPWPQPFPALSTNDPFGDPFASIPPPLPPRHYTLFPS